VSAALAAGGRVGAYTLLSLIGEGGYGSVWLAERREPFVQRVAVKFLKHGMDSRAVIARFERERQALAVMNHPGIARVLDGGLAPDGRPYFVMEYVEGRPITEWCESERLDARARVALVAQVCDAVQHAHVRGMIHRDLKPSNILAMRDGDGRVVARVIDFGIAKLVDDASDRGLTMTEAGQLLGTPEYMSPEQADPDGPEVDTRSDVYSIGAVLYELLTGLPPFGGRDAGTMSRALLLRAVRRDPVPAPSARTPGLPKELDWILLMALRKEPEERYASAAELARDLRRFLAGDVLLAAPESAAYRFRTYARRNRTQVAAAAVVAGTLLAASVVSVVFAVRADVARTEADARAAEASRVADYQSRLIDGIDPAWIGAYAIGEVYRLGDAHIQSKYTDPEKLKEQRLAFNRPMRVMDKHVVGAAVIVKGILEPAEKAIDTDFADLPLAAATLRHAVASRYHLMGNFERAQANVEAALKTRTEQLGPRHPDVASSLVLAGLVAWSMNDLPLAESRFREADAIRAEVFGPDSPERVEARQQLGLLLIVRGERNEAVDVLGEALRGADQHFGADDQRFFGLRRDYAAALIEVGRAAEAEPIARRAMESFATALGEDGVGTVRSQVTLGMAIAEQGRLEEAQGVLADVVGRLTRRYGAEDPDTLKARVALMRVLVQREAAPAHAEEIGRLHAHVAARFGAKCAEALWLEAEMERRGAKAP
jgi:non-specific serine/threonine protein kinase/serine/threonine-protein kinase